MYERIKAYLGNYLVDDTVFFAMLIILVGMASFALGRLSVSALTPTNLPASIVMSTSTTDLSSAENLTETTVAQGSTKAVANKGQFVGSKNGLKYHLPWCSGAKNIKEANKVWFIDAPAAKAAGYTPAANCPGL